MEDVPLTADAMVWIGYPNENKIQVLKEIMPALQGRHLVCSFGVSDLKTLD